MHQQRRSGCPPNDGQGRVVTGRGRACGQVADAGHNVVRDLDHAPLVAVDVRALPLRTTLPGETALRPRRAELPGALAVPTSGTRRCVWK